MESKKNYLKLNKNDFDNDSISSYASVNSINLSDVNLNTNESIKFVAGSGSGSESTSTTTTTTPSSIKLKKDLSNNSNNRTTATTTAARTILTYSDKNRNLFSQTNVTVCKESFNNSNSNELNTNSLDLHHYVFTNDLMNVKKHVDKLKKNKSIKNLNDFLSIKDLHGNTPLHLACMLGYIDIARVLIDAGAVVKSRNKQMWTPLNEAISYGNRELIRFTLKKFEDEVEAIVENAKPKIIEALREMDDFYVEVKWDFESWIPFISRFLPSDTCKLYKLGTRLRVDCTLGDIARGGSKNGRKNNGESAANSVGATLSPFSWERGDLTFLFEFEKFGTKNSVIFMDNTRKVYSIIDKQCETELEHDLEKEVDLLLSKEMIFLKLNTKHASFLPTQVGWFSKRDKLEQINGYMCQFYDVNNLYIVSKLRVEHLSEEELKKREEKQQKIKEQFGNQKSTNDIKKSESSGSMVNSNKITNQNHHNLNFKNDKDDDGSLDSLKNIDLDEEIRYRPSLPPPPKSSATWHEYLNAKEGDWPCLGRKPKCKESKKEFKAQLAMSQEFPLTIQDLNKLLDALVPLAKFRKLKEFINLKLPPGFPVKIDIPIVPAISAKVCFQNFKKNCNLSPSLFEVPKDYAEENLDEPPVKETNNESPNNHNHNESP